MTSDLFPDTAHNPGGKSRRRWPSGSTVTAQFSGENDCYRNSLTEIWDETKPLVGWLLMNPSVANVAFADPTLAKTGNFARLWGFGGQWICNMHAYRATDSAALASVTDPVGPDNDAAIDMMAARVAFIVLAYGKIKVASLRARPLLVADRLRKRGVDLRHLRLTQDGTPEHPLYLPSTLLPVTWEEVSA